MKRSPQALLLLLLAGCGVVETAVDLPGNTIRAVTPGKKAEPIQIDTAELQETLLRFNDSLLRRLGRGIEELQPIGKPQDPADVLRWKIALGTEAVAIATGGNSIANLLDMTVFVSLSRGVIVTYWKPAVYGDSANSLAKSLEDAELELNLLLDHVLTLEQRNEFKQTLEAWRKANPLAENTLGARALGFATQAKKKGETAPGSLFNLINLDPLSGLDPAMQEIARTRAYAERGLYVVQKFPMLIRWQTELLAIDATGIPAVKQVTTSAASIAASADRIAILAEKLPDRVSKEREEILKALKDQEKDVHSVLTAGTALSTSLNATLGTLDGVMKRVGVGEPKPPAPPGPEAPPFQMKDVTEAVAALDATTKHITELLQALDHTLATADLARFTAQVTPIVQKAEASGKDVVDYAFVRVCLLVGAILLAALIYRFVAPRLAPKKP